VRTERRVIVPRDVALHAGYYDRLARSFVVVVDDAIHVHAFEGITVLLTRARSAQRTEFLEPERRSRACFSRTLRGIGLFTVPFRGGLGRNVWVGHERRWDGVRSLDGNWGCVPRYARTSVAYTGSIVNATPGVW
jgi:hypothetical protein